MSASWVYLLCLVMCVNAGQFVDENDPDFLEFQADIYEWYRNNGPKGVNKCSTNDHRDALENLKKRTTPDENMLQNALFRSFTDNDDKGFYGLSETLIGLRSKRVQLILQQSDLFISVVDYRDPSTGHHFFQYHDTPVLSPPFEISNANGTRTYFFFKCLPFSTFIKKVYGRNTPAIYPIEQPTPFFKNVGGIAGFFDGNVLMSSAPPDKVGDVNQRRKFFFIYKEISTM